MNLSSSTFNPPLGKVEPNIWKGFAPLFKRRSQIFGKVLLHFLKGGCEKIFYPHFGRFWLRNASPFGPFSKSGYKAWIHSYTADSWIIG
jgi:hypothetical protein